MRQSARAPARQHHPGVLVLAAAMCVAQESDATASKTAMCFTARDANNCAAGVSRCPLTDAFSQTLIDATLKDLGMSDASVVTIAAECLASSSCGGDACSITIEPPSYKLDHLKGCLVTPKACYNLATAGLQATATPSADTGGNGFPVWLPIVMLILAGAACAALAMLFRRNKQGSGFAVENKDQEMNSLSNESLEHAPWKLVGSEDSVRTTGVAAPVASGQSMTMMSAEAGSASPMSGGPRLTPRGLGHSHAQLSRARNASYGRRSFYTYDDRIGGAGGGFSNASAGRIGRIGSEEGPPGTYPRNSSHAQLSAQGDGNSPYSNYIGEPSLPVMAPIPSTPSSKLQRAMPLRGVPQHTHVDAMGGLPGVQV